MAGKTPIVEEDNNNDSDWRVGGAVDKAGAPAFDPSKNVGDLVKAESKKRDELRVADSELVDTKIECVKELTEEQEKLNDYRFRAESTFQTSMREAESKRIDEKAELQRFYETRIAEMLSKSVESTSTLVSTQLVQIQATFNERVSKLEQFRWESGGKTSISDPAIADTLARTAASVGNMQILFTEALAKMSTSQSEAMNKMAAGIATNRESISETKGRGLGRNELIAYGVAAISAAAALGHFLIK